MTLRPTKHFVRHSAEMVAAMFLLMAVIMTGPMVGWMAMLVRHAEYGGRCDAAVAA